jgi:hypothetical protein
MSLSTPKCREEPEAPVDELLEHGRVELLLPQQIDQAPGSRSPLRVPMITPPVGVNPMLVSIERPPLTAVMLAPLPRCAITSRREDRPQVDAR